MIGIFPKALTRAFNLVTQQYSGHITVWPDFSLKDLQRILDGPTTEMLRNCIIKGSRRVYPSNISFFILLMAEEINRIIATLIIERALEKNYLQARARAELPRISSEISNEYDNK